MAALRYIDGVGTRLVAPGLPGVVVLCLMNSACGEDVILFKVPAEFTTLASGQNHTAALVEGGIVGWGRNSNGELGALEDAEGYRVPVVVDVGPWAEVHVGAGTTCALSLDREVYCRGANNVGQLGQGDREPRDRFVRVPLPEPVRVFSTRYSHSLALLENGELWAWGLNNERQIGALSSPGAVLVPERIGDASWIDASTGQGHSCAVREDQTLWCWGRNTEGQLGAGTTSVNLPQTQIVIGASVVRVRAEQNHSCALTEAGSMLCFGSNDWGSLGDGTLEDRISPVTAAAGEQFVDLDVGTFNTCGRSAGGSYRCWGMLNAGALGTGPTAGERVPTPIDLPLAPEWQEFQLGRVHSCGQRFDGSVWCSGVNADGQLGVGDTRFSFDFIELDADFNRFF